MGFRQKTGQKTRLCVSFLVAISYVKRTSVSLRIVYNSETQCESTNLELLQPNPPIDGKSADWLLLTDSQPFRRSTNLINMKPDHKKTRILPLHGSLHKHEKLTNSKLFCLAFYPQHAEGKQLHKTTSVRQTYALNEHGKLGGKCTLPKVTKPAFAFSASAGNPFNSRGGAGDHIQEGALLSAAVRLASTNS